MTDIQTIHSTALTELQPNDPRKRERRPIGFVAPEDRPKKFLCNGFVVSDFLCNFALQIIILHSSLFTFHFSLLTNERIQSDIEISPYG